MKLTQKRTPIPVRFRLNDSGSDHFLLQCQVNVDGSVSSRFGLKVPDGRFIHLMPTEWDHDSQKMRGNSAIVDEVNYLIDQTRLALLNIHSEQLAAHTMQQKQVDQGLLAFSSAPRPTLQSVLFSFQKKRNPWVTAVESSVGVPQGASWSYSPTEGPAFLSAESDIKQAMAEYLLEVKQRGRRSKRGKMEPASIHVIRRMARTASLLAQFQDKPLPVKSVTAMWADNFHAWLQYQPTILTKTDSELISVGYATRHVKRIVELFTWLHRRRGVLLHNPLIGLKYQGYEDKPVEPLSAEQLAALEVLACNGSLAAAKWWLLLMCYTGLDYPDAKAYVKDQAKFEVMTVAGLTIQGKRNKTGLDYCIPKLRRVDELLAQRPEGYHTYAPQKLNDMIRDELAPAIGFVHHMTIKTGRKTASSLFLEGELNMAEVSRILGHKTVLTTERYYCRTTAQTVINGMKRTGIMNR